jgi:hypothetical protein
MIDEQVFLFLVLATIWSLPWKAWALWLAARRTEKWWFLALLFINTFAVLEIIYIFLIAKRQDHWVSQEHVPESPDDSAQ